MPVDASDIKDGLVIDNLKLHAGAAGHAMATIYQAAAAGFQRREGLLDAALAKQLEDIRFADVDAARSMERMVGHPLAETQANLMGSIAGAISLAKAVFTQPPSGYTFYPGPSSPTGTSPTP